MTKHRQRIVMTFQRVAEALIKANGLHDGIWGVCVEFGHVAGLNATLNDRLLPSALVPILGIGLMQDEAVSDLAVDAAVVNPRAPVPVEAVH